MGSTFHPSSPPTQRWLRRLLVLALVLLCYLIVSWFSERFLEASPMLPTTWHTWLVPIALVLYILLMMLPFMPGIEIGLALLMILDKQGCLLVYIATVFALSNAFCVGRLMPPGPLIGLLKWLNLDRAAGLVQRLEPMSPEQRRQTLEQQLPGWLSSILVRNRYLTLAVVLNLPGNALLGGGGGISITAGMSQLMPMRAFVFVVALAVAPVPLAFYFMS